MVKRILTVLLLFPTLVCAQINTDRVMTIARNALYFEDYVLSIQYFNQVINAKPYLYEPYFFRALAKLNSTGRLRIIRKHCIMIRRILLYGIT